MRKCSLERFVWRDDPSLCIRLICFHYYLDPGYQLVLEDGVLVSELHVDVLHFFDSEAQDQFPYFRIHLGFEIFGQNFDLV